MRNFGTSETQEICKYLSCFYDINEILWKPVENIKRLISQFSTFTVLLQVSGLAPLKPVCSFGHFGFDEQLLTAIRAAKYSAPTPIQAQVS